MKKFILLFLTTICLSFAGCNQHTNASAQQPCITFLGIPVDGTNEEMVSKLKAKGFAYNSFTGYLDGEFNGADVSIDVQTVNGRVWRIAVLDASYKNETGIKIRFNDLFEQFSNNSKYVYVGGNIPSENADIHREILNNSVQYEAVFTCADESINGFVWYMINYEFMHGYSIAMFYENFNNAADGSEL